MWFCNECDCEFDEPRETSDFHAELAGMGGDCSEPMYVCPNCGSDDIELMEECDLCHEPARETIWFGDFEVCDDCRCRIEGKLNEVKYFVQAEFDIDDYNKAERLIGEIAEELW